MSLTSIDPSWFFELITVELRGHYEWLAQLEPFVERIAAFGCCSSEPFALMWTLNASEVKVVEKEKENLYRPLGPLDELEILKSKIPCAFAGRSIDFIVADMSTTVEELRSNYFDLAYCERVLYFMQDNLQVVQNAINEMARVLKPGGWVIAVEPSIGAEFETVTSGFPGWDIPVRKSDPIEIGSLFESAGLVPVTLKEAPDWSYCFRKPVR